jgi:RNA polymerase sigma-70 factor (ECF subfamily)
MSGTAGMTHTDADLMRRWQGGDAAAFAELVHRWQQPVARLVFRLIGRSDLVADLCQDVFLRVYLARDRYRERGAFVPWLYRIVLNAVRDVGRRRHQTEPLLNQELAAKQRSAEAVCENGELSETLARMVGELPPPLREVLVLRHYEGMGFEEIGRVLGLPATTLKSRFSTALNLLRDRLRPLGWGFEETES